jgi:ABC-type transport system involved in cytochrome c biogenesis permease subunit
MLTLIDLLTALLPLLYGLSAANYAIYFVRQEPFSERTCTPALLGTVLVHLGFFVLRYLHFGRYPIANLPEVLSAIALSVAVVYLYVERVQASKTTGIFLVGMSAVVQLWASAFLPHIPESEPSLLAQTSLWAMHTTFVVLGYSAFLVGAVYGLMFALLYRVLKRQRFGLLFERLPSLDVLAGMGIGAVAIGLLGLTAVIIIGIAMSASLVPTFWTDPKFISSLLVWAVYAVAVGGYFFLGWRGARTVALSLIGFAVALLTMVGSTFLWPTFHSFSA